MKRETVPTSPQYKNKPTKKKRVKYKICLPELLLILFISFIGGITGALIIDNYLPNPIQEAREVVYMQGNLQTDKQVLISEALVKIEPSVVNIFVKKAKDDYLPSETLGTGLILTSDGWLVTSADLTAYTDLVVVTNNKKVYEIKKTVVDEYSGTNFLKCGATDLMPAQFADPANLGLNDEVMAVYNSLLSGQRSISTNIENLAFNDDQMLKLSNHPFDYLIRDGLRKEYNSAPLINLQGEVIGLNLLDNRVLPHDYFTEVMPQLISDKKIDRINLSLDYTDLTREIQDKYEYDKGSLILSVHTLETGLFINDIVLKVDEQELDKFHNLNDILYTYKSNDLASFSLIRDNEEIVVEVEL